MTNPPPSADHLVLAPGDNIAVALRPLESGHVLHSHGASLTLRDPVAPGHKFALRDIPEGAQVLKYTVPIGRATRNIQAGESVHTHNLRSDYLPTYTLGQDVAAREEA